MGSVAEQEAASETEPAGVDPWADAFAESSRAAVVAQPRAASSTYPVAVNPQVQRFLDRFTGARRDVVNLWAGRSGRYLGMIREVLKSRGLPEELAYTAMIESGFNPLAVSRVGAKGMWQFMAATARRYGLRVDQWIDERLDPEKSTIAASRYLRDLYNMFGSWALAQAAYNAGEVKVSRAIRATGSSDFWTLAKTNHLRTETKDFVPAIQAATLIAQNPGPVRVRVQRGRVPWNRDRRRPALDRSPAAGGQGGHRARGTCRRSIPTHRPFDHPSGRPLADQGPDRAPVRTCFRPSRRLPRLGGRRPATTVRGGTKRASGSADDVHVVQPRDTVGSIAKQYGVAVRDVLRWNRLQNDARIRPGDRIRVADSRSPLSEGQGGFR